MDTQRVFEPLAIKFVIIRVICGKINKFMFHVFLTKKQTMPKWHIYQLFFVTLHREKENYNRC